MTGLVIFYCCLLVPSLLYILATLFSGTGDVDAGLDCDVDTSSGDFKITLSSLCYFLTGFSLAGLLFSKYGAFLSVTAGLATGVLCYFALKHLFRWIVEFCFSSEVEMSEPEIGDECITLNNIGPDDVGLVRIFKRVGVDNHLDKTMTYFAVSGNGSDIKLDTFCVVKQVEGNRVVVEPAKE